MFDILYQDDCLMVINKPAGLVVTSTETQKGPTLEDILKTDYKNNLERGGIVHRLDKDTSGVMLIGKTLECFDKLQAQFKDRTIKKEYLTLVHGSLEQEGKVEGAIARNPGDREKFVVDDELENGREAVTLYKPITNYQMSDETLDIIFPGLNKNQTRKIKVSKYQNFTLVRCFPLTGRTHQIRVHLKHIGFSIVGDEKYGGRKTSRLDHRWCSRQFLHAAKIEFNHPDNGKRLSFESPIPEDLEKALKNLKPVS